MTDATTVPRRMALEPFRIPVFRTLWIATFFSNMGGLIQFVGASWLMASLTDSPQMIALVQTATSLPIVLLALPGGALADSTDKRRIMLAIQSFLLLISLALAIFTAAGWITPALLLVATFLVGGGAALNQPAWQASVADIVPRPILPNAIAMNSMGFNLARSIGPALGGVLLGLGGAALAFAANALSYVGLLTALARWRTTHNPGDLPRETMSTAISAGVRYAAMSPTLRTVLARCILFGFSATAIPALTALVARDVMRGGPVVYGSLLGAFGFGAVLGALQLGRLRASMQIETIARLGSLAFAVALIVIARSSHIAVTLPAFAVAGACWLITLSTFSVTVQMAVPRWVVARAIALFQVSLFAGMTVGSWCWGEIAARFGTGDALAMAAGGMLLSLAAGGYFRLPNAEELNLDPLRDFDPPQTDVAIGDRSGPIVISIHYRIDRKDVPDFLDAIAQRRRVRMRDGVRNWMLLRDLHDEQIWIERYETVTWVAYVRSVRRLTVADADIGDRLVQLHREAEPPLVYRSLRWQTSPKATGTMAASDEII